MFEIPPTPSARDLNVLILDDQPLVHDIVKNALLESGIKHVKSAENAYFGLKLCEKTRFDIMFIAFNVKSDKDGFHLLEEMRVKGYINKSTSVVFLSADTDKSLVNCVVELQPDDFWVKPLDKKKVETRLKHLIAVKRKLYKLRFCMDHEEYPTAIYQAERQLLDQSLAYYHPYIQRLIGECLIHLLEFTDAEAYYRKLADKCNHCWVWTGLVKSLLKQGKMEEAQERIDELLERDDTRFATYDLLAQYHIEQEDYETAYEQIQKATELAPRNIERNKKSWDLARLNHDRMGQYIATQNMAKYAKNSMHDSPELRLNVIRAGIDLAATMPGEEANKILTQTERRIGQLEQETGCATQLKDQLAIVRARIHNVRDEKNEAEAIIANHMDLTPVPSIEDNLDKVKAFHELGYREESLTLLDSIKDQIAGDSFSSRVVAEYISQEADERSSIHFSPKELGEMASVYYKQKRMKPAFTSLSQAFQLSPKNLQLAMSLLKVLSALKQEEGLDEHQLEIAQDSLKVLDDVELPADQQKKLQAYKEIIEDQGAA